MPLNCLDELGAKRLVFFITNLCKVGCFQGFRLGLFHSLVGPNSFGCMLCTYVCIYLLNE